MDDVQLREREEPAPSGDARSFDARTAEIESLRREVERLQLLASHDQSPEGRARLVLDVTTRLNKTVSDLEAAEVVLEPAISVLGADAGAISRVAPDDLHLEALVQRGCPPDRAERFRWLSISDRLPFTDAVSRRELLCFSTHEELARQYPQVHDELPYEALIAAPMLVDQRAVGAIALLYRDRRTFEAEAFATLTTLTGQCARAFERARLYQRERDAREQAERLQSETSELLRVAEASNRSRSLTELFDPALDAVSSILAVDRASILLFDEQGVMRFRAWRGLSEPYRRAVDGHSPWSRGDADAQPIFVEDTETDASMTPYRDVFRSENIRSLGSVPLVDHGRLVGKVMVYSDRPRTFSGREKQLARTIAAQLAHAVGRAELFESERRARATAERYADRALRLHGERARLFAEERSARTRAEAAQRRTAFLLDASIVLSSSLDYRSTLDQMARLAVTERIAEGCLVEIIRSGEASPEHVAVAHRDPAKAPLVVELGARHRRDPDAADGVAKVLRTGRSELVEQVSAPLPADLAVASLMIAPMVARGQVFGTITFIGSEASRPFDRSDVELAELLGRRAGIAIDNARLFEAERAARSKAEAAEQALKEADRRKDEFLALLAHELRNPLAPIRSAVHILNLKKPVDPVLQRSGVIVERQVAHMTRMIDDLLDVSRITKGKITVKHEAVDLVALVEAVIEDHRSAIDAARVTLRSELPEGPLWTTGDSTRLAQVLGNLVSNSVKFTDPGGQIDVRMVADAERATITVRDTGVGIAPDFIERVFEPFLQADTSLSRTRGGLGLGLALVKGLVELHGGTVRAGSEGIGRGAELTVELPIRAPEWRADARAEHEAVRPLRLLIVDDNADAAEMMAALLDIRGHKVTTALDGLSAIETARRFRPEVVLCDIGLPDMDGYQVARAFRADVDLASIYLVALTGYGQAEDRARARQAGFDMHLTKPVEPKALERVLAGALGGSD